MANKYHVRSNSFPSGSHPGTVRVEEELNKLRTLEAPSTSESIGTGLSLLQDLYVSLDDLLNMASTQKLISHHEGENCMEELLDGSVRLLDICGIARDTMLHIKENVQALHSALRRRKGDSSIETSVAEYNSFTKKVKKNARKLIKSLKQMHNKFGVCPLLNEDHHVIKVLREVIVVSMSIFQSLLSFLAAPASNTKATKWLFVAKLMNKKRVACEENSSINELQCVDGSLSTLLGEVTNMEKMQATRERLEALENAIESLENGLERVFRSLVKTRVSLLNVMT